MIPLAAKNRGSDGKGREGTHSAGTGDITGPEMIEDEQIRRLLSPEAKMDLKIERGFADLKGSYCVLAVTSPESYSDARNGLFRRFVQNEKMPGLYVSINKTYEKLKEELDRNGIESRDMQFIDAVTRMAGSVVISERNVLYLESPAGLSALMIAIEKKIKSIPQNKKFLVLDSVSTLLVYNEAGSVEKFVHALVGKINQHRARGILLLVRSRKCSGTIQTISQFCDRVIEI